MAEEKAWDIRAGGIQNEIRYFSNRFLIVLMFNRFFRQLTPNIVPQPSQ